MSLFLQDLGTRPPTEKHWCQLFKSRALICTINTNDQAKVSTWLLSNQEWNQFEFNGQNSHHLNQDFCRSGVPSSLTIFAHRLLCLNFQLNSKYKQYSNFNTKIVIDCFHFWNLFFFYLITFMVGGKGLQIESCMHVISLWGLTRQMFMIINYVTIMLLSFILTASHESLRTVFQKMTPNQNNDSLLGGNAATRKTWKFEKSDEWSSIFFKLALKTPQLDSPHHLDLISLLLPTCSVVMSSPQISAGGCTMNRHA